MFSIKCKCQLEELNTDLPSIFVSSCRNKNRKRLPSSLSLDGRDIEFIDFDEQTLDIVSDVKTIHLNHNKIKSWKDVTHLLLNMANLKALNLSCNPLSGYERLKDYFPNEFLYTSLHSLVLNETKISWKMVLEIMIYLPSLFEIHLCKNESLCSLELIDEVQTNKIEFKNLKQLFYNCNNCSDPRELQIIGRIFPDLDKLICLGNSFDRIHNDLNEDDGSVHKDFSNLTSLNISENKLSDWNNIDYLNNFEKLNELRIAGQPLFEEMTEEYIWNQLIARLDNINKLNGSRVDNEDKINAERAFIRYYLDSDDKPNKFYSIREKHPDVNKLAEIDFSAKDSIKAVLKYDHKQLEIDLDTNMSLLETLNHFMELLDIDGDPRDYLLNYWDEEWCIQLPVNRTQRKLHSYKIRSGDLFEVVEKK